METTPPSPLLLHQAKAGVVTLTLNRPAQMNLLTHEMLAALQGALEAIAQDDAARVIVIAARGEGFCAGHDLKEIQTLHDAPSIARLFAACSHLMQTLTRLPQPVIARVHGMAAAAGCQLVAQCDLAIASDTARFSTPGVRWGFFCATPAVPLSRTLQRKRALEMLLTGDVIDAATAQSWGLINQVVPVDQLDVAINLLAQKIAAQPRASVASGKRAFYQQLDLDVPAAYALASEVISASFAHPEGREGMAAFLEKRPPNWSA
jgi:enoyl-CoA hydratase/carnithine racemase